MTLQWGPLRRTDTRGPVAEGADQLAHHSWMAHSVQRCRDARAGVVHHRSVRSTCTVTVPIRSWLRSQVSGCAVTAGVARWVIRLISSLELPQLLARSPY